MPTPQPLASPDLKQGDVLSTTPSIKKYGHIEAEHVAIISQTCDVTQKTKKLITLAPVVDLNKEDQSGVKKGRKPLLIPVGESDTRAANLEGIFSVPKTFLDEVSFVEASVSQSVGDEASVLAARIGRAFSRFAFPDEVHDKLKKFSDAIRDKYFKESALGRVFQLAHNIMVECEDWSANDLEITVHIIVASKNLVSSDLDDHNAKGEPKAEPPATGTDLNSTCQLLLDSYDQDAPMRERRRLWNSLAEMVEKKYFQGPSGQYVSSVRVTVSSGDDITYTDYQRMENLEFADLSHSAESS